MLWSARAAAGAAIALALSCAMQSRTSAPQPGAFVRSEYAAYDSTGTAQVEGWGSAAPGPDLRRSIALRTVALMPVTTWSRAWWSRSVLAAGPGGLDHRVERYMRTTDADSLGRFRFTALASGRYYALTSIVWATGPTGSVDARLIRVWLGKEVALDPGEHARVTLDSLRTELAVADTFSLSHLYRGQLGEIGRPDFTSPWP